MTARINSAPTSVGQYAKFRKSYKDSQHCCLPTRPLARQIREILAGLSLPGRQREVVRVMLERGLERIYAPCFGATVPQVFGWLVREGIPGSKDTVQRAFRSLEGLGIATMRQRHIHDGTVRLAAQWHFDFGSWLPLDFFQISLPQNASLPVGTKSFEKSKNLSSNKQARSTRPRSASLASDPRWRGCLEILGSTGDRLDEVRAEAKLASSGRTPEEALVILQGAIAQAAKRQAEGEFIRSVVGYALEALPQGAWGQKLLSQAAQLGIERQQLSEEAAEAAVELAGALDLGVEEAKAIIGKVDPCAARSGVVVAVRAALSLADRRAASGRVDNRIGLVRFFLGGNARELASELRRHRAWRDREVEIRQREVANQQRMRLPGPLADDPRARIAHESWRRLQASAPPPDSPGYLEHFDAERQAHRAFVAIAETALGLRTDGLRQKLAARLTESGINDGTLVWKRAWEHHWNRLVCEAWGLQC